ncbi:MAG: hypothetical protein AB2807_11915 [Candidatus Sedimenticola endophacoides]
MGILPERRFTVLFAGSRLEERKLLIYHEERYRRYQERVHSTASLQVTAKTAAVRTNNQEGRPC